MIRLRVLSLRFIALLLVMPLLPLLGERRGDSSSRADTPVEQSDLVVERGDSLTRLRLAARKPFHTTVNEVLKARHVGVPGTSVGLALWEETFPAGEVVPFCGISLDGRRAVSVRPISYKLRLWHGEFDPLERVPEVIDPLAAGPGVDLYIVQFVSQALDVYREGIVALGGTVYKYVANHAYIVRMDPSVRRRVAALPHVRWVGPYHPAYRLEEFLRLNLHKSVLRPSLRYNIQVFERGMAQKATVAGRIAAIGGVVENRSAGVHLLDATLTPAQLLEVIQWDEVQFVDRWGPLEVDIDLAREFSGADYVESVGGYTGLGVRAEVFDTDFNLDHCDFDTLLVHGAPVSLCAGGDTHGAATSGIIFGDGSCDPSRRGLLPDAQGIVAEWPGSGNPFDRYAHTAELLEAPHFAVFQSASVGNPRVTEYTTISADMDAMLFDLDILHFQSQSNAGGTVVPHDSRPQAWAKNIVSVGGIRHFDTLSENDDCWGCGWTAGSTGPASDGRIKPDLAHFYDLVQTVGCGFDGSQSFGGTSAATPITAGLAGLFFQMWHDGIFANPTGATVFDSRPHMSTAKAMLINTAAQWDFCTQGDDPTRIHQGWGRADVQRLYDLRDDIFVVDESEAIAPFEIHSYQLSVLGQHTALRATLVYADPAGNPAVQAQHRINDLSLSVISPSNVTYWGNQGLTDGNWSLPGGAANDRDTVENVFVLLPEAGSWTVQVVATEINEDGHVETPELDADYALVLSTSSEPIVDCNANGTLDACETDCNSNGTPDDCDISSGASQDCNLNGVPDDCEADCNSNGVADDCDLASGASQDCNLNGIPDDCEADCNSNGVADGCDISSGASQDCNVNGIPDDCEADCDGNGIPDQCDDPIAIFFVDSLATGANDGSTWADAFVDLQDALVAAGCRDHIWVSAGTYTPDGGTGSREATFDLISGVALYGGFSGVETELEERDPVMNWTILSGDLNGDDLPGFVNYDENSYHVVTSSGALDNAILDGFTVIGGNTDGDFGVMTNGAGIHVALGSPTLRNCTFALNSSINLGGGVFSTGDLNIRNCEFIGNRCIGGPGKNGAGMHTYGNATLVDCVFLRNSSDWFGGGFSASSSADATLINCLFSGNVAQAAGGGASHGGTMTAINCTFSGNSALGGFGGGGIINSGAALSITNCILWENAPDQIAGFIPTVNHSCVQAGLSALGGSGNINDNPLFVDSDGPDDIVGTEDDNLRLRPRSPCIDSGTNVAVTVATDLDGSTRIVDGLGFGGAVVDMGAYEFLRPADSSAVTSGSPPGTELLEY